MDLKYSYIGILLVAMLFTGCSPKRPEPPTEKARLFYPNGVPSETDTIVSSSSKDDVDITELESTVKTRTLAIFQEVLRLYNLHRYTEMDKKAMLYCTENVKQKYLNILKEWNLLSEEEKAEYVEGPSLWWYFIGGNIDTRSGRSLKVSAQDLDIICLDKEMAMVCVTQKVSDMECTYCKVFLKNVDDVWLIDDLVPEAIGGDGYNRSFMNDHW